MVRRRRTAPLLHAALSLVQRCFRHAVRCRLVVAPSPAQLLRRRPFVSGRFLRCLARCSGSSRAIATDAPPPALRGWLSRLRPPGLPSRSSGQYDRRRRLFRRGGEDMIYSKGVKLSSLQERKKELLGSGNGGLLGRISNFWSEGGGKAGRGTAVQLN